MSKKSEEYLPELANVNIGDVQSTIKQVMLINDDEWSDGKVVTITVELMLVPKKMDIKISKK